MAVDDDLIRKNPFGFELASVIVNDSVTREAITRKQERDLFRFIREDKHFSRYYDAIYILFHTGLRISEFCGLTIPDIDFEEMRIKMPKVTPHVCRHTFCSNMAKSGMNPKTLQYIMGHSDISVTLNTYTHVNFDDAKEELRRVAND